jgi:hypothetical protein
VDAERQIPADGVPHGGDHVIGRGRGEDHVGSLHEPGLKAGEFVCPVCAVYFVHFLYFG